MAAAADADTCAHAATNAGTGSASTAAYAGPSHRHAGAGAHDRTCNTDAKRRADGLADAAYGDAFAAGESD